MPNSLDLPRCTNLWSEQQRTLFYQLPIYMTKLQVDTIQWNARHTKLLKPVKWQANMGNTMQGVRKVKSPILRSQAAPNPITSAPKRDVIEVRETQEQAILFRQNFESQLMQFIPSFADFLTDHVDATTKDIAEKVQVYQELFVRTAMFDACPRIWLCGKAQELTEVPGWTSPWNGTLTKTAAVMQALLAQVSKPMTLRAVSKLNTVMYSDLRISPFTGNSTGDGSDGSALKHKYCLVMGTELWDGWVHDPFLQGNRAIDLDIITDGFQGSLFGRFTSMFEQYELRFKADGTAPAPELVEENPARYNVGEPLPNPDWVNAPFGVMWAYGNEGYKSIQVGPPPRDFAGGGMTMDKFNGMDWNGKVSMTRNVLVPCLDAQNNVTYDTNKRGEYLQILADLAMGILPVQRRNVIPIIYARQRVATN